jgi:DNA-3-methyladenine glycosylase
MKTRHAAEPPGALRRIGEADFTQGAVEFARGLLGVVMSRQVDGEFRQARILEVEAYLGPRDLASHSSKGRTKRTEVMFGPPGRAYVYFIYGMHWMFNIVSGREGEAHAVLVRSAQPLGGWEANLVGPARFARAFAITGKDNGLLLSGVDIQLHAEPGYRPRIAKSKRVGVDYAGRWKDRLLRFIDVRNPDSAKLRY